MLRNNSIKIGDVKEMVKFVKFLKKKGIYEQYSKNLELKGKPIITFLKTTHPLNYLFSAFGWLETEEGGNYWCEIDHEWKKSIGKTM